MPKPPCPNMATATPPRLAGARTAQKQHAGSLEVDAQPSAARIHLPEGAAQTVSASVRRAYIPGHLRRIGPRTGDLEGPRSPATEQPGIRRLRTGAPARRWRLRDACGLSRLNNLLALWSQAHVPSCNRQVTSTSVHMAKPGPATAPAVTHRCNRTHCLWLEQFQICRFRAAHVGKARSRGQAQISRICGASGQVTRRETTTRQAPMTAAARAGKQRGNAGTRPADSHAAASGCRPADRRRGDPPGLAPDRPSGGCQVAGHD
jgi:hypothetical protein